MDEFKRSNFIFAIVNVIIVLLIFIFLPSVSAVSYSVNSSISKRLSIKGYKNNIKKINHNVHMN
ncbi:hypothetical protein MARBORIA2_02920 [Methanobrevibacter arboriphilus]|jgi:hypothetical protein|uniref:Uncharacterized protein n=2 Tax=Methanobrevibacter arboriphilus TaxID=39441 RepID=A0ACA8R356_METAZ|nr:hypothetical protein [Methanobrevibacter arboriphilus]BBL62083.1 hypothetical protein MarbSA_11230 [Methanobrevibacter arboriphilus]GLI11202.1 hypothetical protein MARBORIA2_02920 [Methanobrevibacter arboriphilus]